MKFISLALWLTLPLVLPAAEVRPGDTLGDVRAAAQTMRQAVQIDPSDFDLVRELCDLFTEAGDTAMAVAVVGEILETEGQPPMRVGLLRLRAELSARQHDDGAAVRDLEEALALGAGDAGPELAAALSRVAGRAAGTGDRASARAASLRLVEVLRLSGDDAQADQDNQHQGKASAHTRPKLYVL